MIERKPFNELQHEDIGWLKTWRHLPSVDASSHSGWGCVRAWNDEQIAPDAGFALQAHANVEIITYVREGVVTHRDSLGNEGRIEAGAVQVVSAGVGMRHAEYNLERVPARIFQIWIAPRSLGGAPAWGIQQCLAAECAGHFTPIASGLDGDHDALPIRARARVLNARLRSGESIEHALGGPRLAYLVPSSGAVAVDNVRINTGDGAAIRDIDTVTVVALEDADVIMIDII